MSFTTVPSVITGQTYSASDYNTYIKDNLNTLWVYTTAGDIAYATSATVLARLALVPNGVLIGGASAPSWLAIGSTGQYLGVTAGAPAWRSDSVPLIFTAAGDLVYGSSAGVAAILNKPTAARAMLQETSSGVPSWRSVTHMVERYIVAEATNVDTSSGIGYFYCTSFMNGMNLTRATAFVATAGVTNPTTIQVRNLTAYPSNDALSTAISIASGGTSATPGVVDTSYDNVATNDRIKIYVTAQSTTKPKGLWVVLEFELP